jgi:VCBS repeat protein
MGNAPISVHLADLNGDALEDLATGNQGSEDLTVRLGNGAGGFGGVLAFALNTYVPFPPHGPNSTDVADLDGDGRLEVAAANYWDSAAAVLSNLTPYPTGFLEFGTGTPGCDGFHGINLSRIPQIGASDLVIFSTQAPRHALELLLVTDSANPAGADELGVGCLLHASLLSATFVMAADMTSDGLGVARALTPVPNNPLIVGSAFHAQSISYFPGGCPSNPLGLTSSRGGTITIQP